MAFPIGNPTSNTKKYKFPVTPFSSRNDNRIANFFRLRNIENDLNDFAKHIQTYANAEHTTEVITKTISFTASEHTKTLTFAASDITKSGKVPVAIFACESADKDIAVTGFNLNGDTATVDLVEQTNYLAAKGVVTNVAYASGTSGALTVTKLQGVAKTNITITLEILYRKTWSNYSEKQ